MCTIIAAFQVHPDYPLWIAANREEFYARKATVPERVGGYVAGRDLTSGGTWLGVTTRGFFVGLTNQRAWQGSAAGTRSRGEIVRDALEDGTPEGTRALLGALDAREMGGFNLMFGDARELWVAYARPSDAKVRLVQLDAGVVALANDELGSPHFPKCPRAEARARALITRRDQTLVSGFEELLADRSTPPLEDVPPPPDGAFIDHTMAHRLQALCVETPIYGTVSAAIIGVGAHGVALHRYAPAAPEVGSFVDALALHDQELLA